jgi:hypothetical protein
MRTKLRLCSGVDPGYNGAAAALTSFGSFRMPLRIPLFLGTLKIKRRRHLRREEAADRVPLCQIGIALSRLASAPPAPGKRG